MKNLKDYLVPTITLFVICLVATALLGLTNQVTAPIIEQLAIETEIKSRQVVFAEAKSFGEAEILADGTSVVAALDESGNTIGHVVVNTAKGYGGDITLDDKNAAKKRSTAVAQSAKEMGADCMITACPLCLYNITKNAETDIEVKYFTELIAEAFGIK